MSIFSDERIKIEYHKGNNYGDKINEILWPKYIDQVNLSCSVTICGIGTILKKSKVGNGSKIIFGSGAGYGKAPKITKEWLPYCVRGPKTAQAIDISQKYAVTDPAIMLVEFFEKRKDRSGVAFLPHQSSLRRVPWQKYCTLLGLEFISPRWSIESVTKKINKSKFILTEAMHGAIMADALRVPWIPVKMNDKILEFKWKDWCSSMNLNYDPVRLGTNSLEGMFDMVKWRLEAPVMMAKLNSRVKKRDYFLSSEKIFENKLKKLKNIMEILVDGIENDRLFENSTKLTGGGNK